MKYRANTITNIELEKLQVIFAESDIKIELNNEKTVFHISKINNGKNLIMIFSDRMDYYETSFIHKIELYKHNLFTGSITIMKN